MERPSHIAFSHPHVARRLPLFALAAFLQVGAVFLIMTGLGHFHALPPGGLIFRPVPKQPTIDPPMPPVPTEIKPVLPHAITPIVDITPDRGPTTITTTTQRSDSEKPTPPQNTQPPQPDHAAVGIAATHTIPPYPPIALRQGLEGKVLLRLTVLESGRVAKADVVTSSGSDALDQAAQAWILSHWAYRPATDHGQPVSSQALASVTFSLKNAR